MSGRLIFPEEILTQHLVVLGKTGAGKSSALRHIVEHLLTKQKRVCIIDPKGDWYGLKSSADGKGAGFPVVLFGDFKNPDARDVPISEFSGRPVAELVVGGNRPCVIGFRGWTQGEMHRFWIDFASVLFNSNGGELYFVVDEVHNFAPKGKVLSPEIGKCLHWANRIMNEGRGIGLVNLIASQRPQKVHNDTLTACETLVAMRVVHTRDRDAVEEWIDGCGDPGKGKEVLNALAGMKRGEAYVWSAEVGFGPTRLTFPMFTTYDSFAPPQLLKKISNNGWADVDLSEVKEKLAAAIEKAKQDDPKELRKQIADLKRAQQKNEPDPQAVERAVAKAVAEAQKEFQQAQRENERAINDLRGRLDKIASLAHLNGNAPAIAEYKPVAPRVVVDAPRPAPAPRRPSGDGGEVGNTGLRRILVALAQRPQGMSARQIGVRSGLSSKSGSFGTYLSRARTNGWIQGDRNHLQITDAGIAALGDYDPLPTGDALLQQWLGELGDSGASRILKSLASAYPESLTKAEVAERAELSAGSGSFGTYLSRLRSLELISGKGDLCASEELFD
jgi:hypothetical protein